MLKAKKCSFEFKERKGGAINVSMEDIMVAADKLDLFEGTNYRRRTLEGNIYETENAEKITHICLIWQKDVYEELCFDR